MHQESGKLKCNLPVVKSISGTNKLRMVTVNINQGITVFPEVKSKLDRIRFDSASELKPVTQYIISALSNLVSAKQSICHKSNSR